MWYYIPISLTKGDRFQDKKDPSIIIEFERVEGDANDPIFVFNTSDGQLRITRSVFSSVYETWIDPWASQKKFALKHGFTWYDEEIPAIPKVKMEF